MPPRLIFPKVRIFLILAKTFSRIGQKRTKCRAERERKGEKRESEREMRKREREREREREKKRLPQLWIEIVSKDIDIYNYSRIHSNGFLC